MYGACCTQHSRLRVHNESPLWPPSQEARRECVGRGTSSPTWRLARGAVFVSSTAGIAWGPEADRQAELRPHLGPWDFPVTHPALSFPRSLRTKGRYNGPTSQTGKLRLAWSPSVSEEQRWRLKSIFGLQARDFRGALHFFPKCSSSSAMKAPLPLHPPHPPVLELLRLRCEQGHSPCLSVCEHT